MNTNCFPGYRVECEATSRRLSILSQDVPRKLVQRMISTIVILVLIGFAYSEVQPYFSLEVDDDVPGEAFGGSYLLVVTMLGIFFIGGMLTASWLGKCFGYWSLLEWDRAANEFRARYRGRFLWGWRSYRIEFSRINCIWIRVSSDKAGQMMTNLQLIHHNRRMKLRWLSIDLVHGHMPDISDVKDWLFRIGHLIDFHAYVEPKIYTAGFELKLIKTLESEDEAQPILSVDQLGSDVTDDDESSVPEPAVANFDPKDLNSKITATQVTDWLPGDRARFYQAANRGAAYTVIGILAAMGAAVCTYVELAGTTWVSLSLGALIGATCGAVLAIEWFFERQLLIDWTKGQLSERRLGRNRSYSLDEVNAVVIRTLKKERQVNGTWVPDFTAVLELELPRCQLIIVQTEEWKSSASTPYGQLMPLASALSQALNVPLRRWSAQSPPEWKRLWLRILGIEFLVSQS